MSDGFHAIPARWHPDVHKRQRVGAAFGQRLLEFRQTLLPLVGGVDLKHSDRSCLLAKEEGLIVLEIRLSLNFAEQDLSQILMNRPIVVDDENSVVGLG
ncbi:MAG: hypothetical protein IPP47_23535 [Bryobacterales bacterium]|nr:hypothetical protein [Bryobacterales bacterium]